MVQNRNLILNLSYSKKFRYDYYFFSWFLFCCYLLLKGIAYLNLGEEIKGRKMLKMYREKLLNEFEENSILGQPTQSMLSLSSSFLFIFNFAFFLKFVHSIIILFRKRNCLFRSRINRLFRRRLWYCKKLCSSFSSNFKSIDTFS